MCVNHWKGTWRSLHEPLELDKTGLANTIITYVLIPGGRKWILRRIGNRCKIWFYSFQHKLETLD